MAYQDCVARFLGEADAAADEIAGIFPPAFAVTPVRVGGGGIQAFPEAERAVAGDARVIDHDVDLVAVGGDRVVCCDRRGRIRVNGVPLRERDYLGRDTAPSTKHWPVSGMKMTSPPRTMMFWAMLPFLISWSRSTK